MMKTTGAFFLAVFAAATVGFAETRTFTSSDGQRTFQGTLVGYNSGTQVVTVRNENGQTLHFNIDLISEKDQEFVKKAPPQTNVAMDVRFEPLTERKDVDRTNETRVTNYDGGYKISLLSYTPHDLNNVEVDYLLIYRKDDVKEKAENRTVRGKASVNIPANGTEEIETETVKLVNFFKRAKVHGSGCSTCPKAQTRVTAPQRSRDMLIGCVARVKLNGEVISLTASSPNLLRDYADELESSSH